MERTAKHNQFIALRADGLSYDKIATKLKASKGALIQWSKYYEDEIKALQFESFIEIKETYKYNQKSKYEMLLKQLDKIDNAVLDTDVSNASIKDLFTIKSNIEYCIYRSIRTLLSFQFGQFKKRYFL